MYMKNGTGIVLQISAITWVFAMSGNFKKVDFDITYLNFFMFLTYQIMFKAVSKKYTFRKSIILQIFIRIGFRVILNQGQNINK